MMIAVNWLDISESKEQIEFLEKWNSAWLQSRITPYTLQDTDDQLN